MFLLEQDNTKKSQVDENVLLFNAGNNHSKEYKVKIIGNKII